MKCILKKDGSINNHHLNVILDYFYNISGISIFAISSSLEIICKKGTIPKTVDITSVLKNTNSKNTTICIENDYFIILPINIRNTQLGFIVIGSFSDITKECYLKNFINLLVENGLHHIRSLSDSSTMKRCICYKKLNHSTNYLSIMNEIIANIRLSKFKLALSIYETSFTHALSLLPFDIAKNVIVSFIGTISNYLIVDYNNCFIYKIYENSLDKLASSTEYSFIFMIGKSFIKETQFFILSSIENDPKCYLIKKVINYITQNYDKYLSLSDVANKVKLSPGYLSTNFKKETGESFTSYLNKVRIENSKLLFETTDHSIVDIALAVGFDNQNYFTTVFKKYTGLTPKKYRMSLKRN
ncbi:AraC family transcriptional regulator [Clostridiaceae bacterium M8S5]|nr:AraC family transcriptional regulator [Clostridiaceae bacterium M8S5]